MNIKREHTYAAKALIQMMIEDGVPFPPPLRELELDFPRVLAELKKHADHFEKHAGVIETLRLLGHWQD